MAVGEFCEGASGGQLLVLTGTVSYIADVTTEEQRAWRMLLIELCGGFGGIIAEISLGFLISSYGFLASALLALSMYSTAFLYILIFIPETIQRAKNVKLFSVTHFKKSVLVLFKKKENGNGILRGYTFRRYRLGVIVLLMFTFFAVYGGEEITTYYIINPPLCFDSIYIGFYRAFDYIIRFAAGILLERYAQNRLIHLHSVALLLDVFNKEFYMFPVMGLLEFKRSGSEVDLTNK